MQPGDRSAQAGLREEIKVTVSAVGESFLVGIT